MKINKKAISLNIAKYRIKANMTQIELSKSIGLSKGYISTLESNRGHLPSMSALCDIAKELKIDPDMILYENLKFYGNLSENYNLKKELYFLEDSDLKFILSFLRIYIRKRKELKKISRRHQ